MLNMMRRTLLILLIGTSNYLIGGELTLEYLKTDINADPVIKKSDGPPAKVPGSIIDSALTDRGTHYLYRQLPLGDVQVDLLLSETEDDLRIYIFSRSHGYDLDLYVLADLDLPTAKATGASGFAAFVVFAKRPGMLADLTKVLQVSRDYLAHPDCGSAI